MTEIVWKKIYHTVSRGGANATPEVVTEVLESCKDAFLNGFKQQGYSRDQFVSWSNDVNISASMKEFVHELCQDFGLEGKLMYSILCNYLMFEYHGKIREFWQLTALGTTTKLKESIWMFFISERMFHLQTLRYILEYVNGLEHPLSSVFRTFLNSIDISLLQDNMIAQLEDLLVEVAPSYFLESPSKMEKWLIRNTREQIVIVFGLILSTVELKLNASQFTIILKLLGDHMCNTKAVSYDHPENRVDVQELTYAEVGLFFAVIESFWGDNMAEFFQTENGQELKASMASLITNHEMAVILLAWIVLKHDVGASEIEDDRIEELVSKDPFVFLQKVVSHPMFKNCVLGNHVMNSVHRFVDKICLVYLNRTGLYQKPGLIPVLAELLKTPTLTTLCLQQRNGADFFIELVYKTFPYDFFSLTTVARATITDHKFTNSTISLLNRIPCYLSDLTWDTPAIEVCVLRGHQRAIANTDLIVFKPNTKVCSFRIFDQNLLQYQGEYSYFVYLEYLVSHMLEIARERHVFDEELVAKVTAGYELVIDLLHLCPGCDFEQLGIKKVIEQLDVIIQHNEGDLINYNLVKIYFRAYLVRIRYHDCNFLREVNDNIFTSFLPKLKSAYVTADVKNMLYEDFIFENTILVKVFQQEEMNNSHVLLLVYLELLLTQIHIPFENTSFQLAGVSYILKYVLLQHQTWTYNDAKEKPMITISVMKILHMIMRKMKPIMTHSEKRLYELVYYSLFYNPNIIEAFLRLFVKDKDFIVMTMECEPNWSIRERLPMFQALRWQLALLLIMMRRRKEEELTDTVFYDKLELIVKSIVSYFVNDHSTLVSQLACRFLEKLAEDENTRLLALLEFDHYQVQALFLERLRDPLEEEELKLAIVDLITTCVSKQNGMMAAFLNMKCFLYWDGSPVESYSGDTVSDFMVDYLHNVKKSREYLKNPLQLGILKLLHKLWLSYRTHLLKNVSDLEEFWPTMINPLRNDFVYDHEVYDLILKIINLEITANPDDVDKNLTKELGALMSHEEDFHHLVDFMLRCSALSNIELVSTFMEFTVLAIKIVNEHFTDNNKFIITLGCLDAIEITMTEFTKQEFIYIWSQLYLLVVQAWPLQEDREEAIVKKLTMLFDGCTAHYTFLTPRVKVTLYSIIHQMLVQLKNYFATRKELLLEFLKPVGNMIDNEYEVFESEDWLNGDDNYRCELAKSWMIGVMICNVLLEYDNVKDLGIWFCYREIGQKVLAIIPKILDKMTTLGLARLAIDFLNSFAASPLNVDMAKMNLLGFYYKIRSPDLTVKPMEFILNGLSAAKKEWWHVYLCLTRFNRTLLSEMKMTAVPICLAYITQCDRAIYDCLQLPKDTVDLTALDLVQELVLLFCLLQDLKPDWGLEVPQTYACYMESLKVALNACSLTLIATKKITFYEVQTSLGLTIVEDPPTQVIVQPLSKMIEIIFWTLNTLRKTKPDLHEMLQGHFSSEMVSHLVNDFSVPKFDFAIVPVLTYGTLLCLAHYLCKAVNFIDPTNTMKCEHRQLILTGHPERISMKTLDKLVEYVSGTYDKHIGFIIKIEDIPTERLPTFMYYELADVVTSPGVIEHFNYNIVAHSLEVLMTFLTGEILCSSKNMDIDTLIAYKRELGSELQFFYEFVRKRSSDFQAKISSPASTSRSATLFHDSDKEIIQKYIQAKNMEGEGELSDNDFILVIAQWLIGFCESPR